MSKDELKPMLDYASAPKEQNPAAPVWQIMWGLLVAALGVVCVFIDIGLRADTDVPRKILLLEILFGSISLLLAAWALVVGASRRYGFWLIIIVPAALFCIYFATLYPRPIHN
jgi:hypothetical protein